MAKSNVFKGRGLKWAVSLVLALVAAFGTLTLVGQYGQRTNYWVVASDVAARTLITPDLVKSVAVPLDAVPATALSDAQINSGTYFSKIALPAGTVVSKGVVTVGLDPLSTGLPAGEVMSSLVVSPENAAGGRIAAGDHVNVTAVETANGAVGKIVLQYVLVLAVTVAPDTVATAANNSSTGSTPSTTPGVDNAALYGGIPQMYTFAVSPADSVKLALVRHLDVYLSLVTGAAPTAALDVAFNAQSLFAAGSVDPSSTFTAASTDTQKTAVELFYNNHVAKGEVVKQVGTNLVAYDKTSGNAVGQVSTKGGSFDLTSGTFTSGN